MQILDSNNTKINEKKIEIIEVNGTYYLKSNCDIILNNVLVNSRYVVVSKGDFFEIEDGLQTEKYYIVEDDETAELVEKNDSRHCNPFIIPPYQMFPKLTGILGILYAHNNYKEWLFRNCNLIWAYKWIWNKAYWTDFVSENLFATSETTSIIDVTEIDKTDLINGNHIIEFMERELNGKYLFIELDMWVVGEWWNSDKEKYHLNHPVLIYGYDSAKKIVYCADFIKMKYRKYELDYDQFVGAVIGGYYGGERYFQTWKYNDVSLEYDIKLIKHDLKDFILSRNTRKHDYLYLGAYCNTLYGFEAIERIIKEIFSQLTINRFWDWRSIHIIKINNQIMKEFVCYLNSKSLIRQCMLDLLLNVIDNINSKTNTIELMLIKSRIKLSDGKSNKIFEKMNEMISDMREFYAILFESLGDDISAYQKYKYRNNWDAIKLQDDEETINRDDIYLHSENIKNLIESYYKYRDSNNLESINKVLNQSSYSIIVSDYYEDVFPYEIEEDGYACLGEEIGTRDESSINNKVYFYNSNNHVCAIEYSSAYKIRKYMIYQYDDNKILRLKYKKVGEELILENVKMQVEENEIYVYSYKPEKNELKIDMYYIKEGKCIDSKRYRCNSTSMPLEKWVKEKWAEKKKYIYNKEGKLLQIYIYDYDGKRKMIYSNMNEQFGRFSNLNMQLGENKIVKQFVDELVSFVDVCSNRKICVELDSTTHTVIYKNIENENQIKSFSFLEEYDIKGEGINRFNLFFAMEILYFNKENKCHIEYYFDKEKIKVEDGTFISEYRL